MQKLTQDCPKKVRGHMSPVSTVTSIKELGRGIDVIRHRHNRESDSTRDQKMRKSVLDQQQSEELLIAAETFRMDRDGAINQPDQKDEVNADPFRRRYRGARHSDSQTDSKCRRNQDQHPGLKLNIFSEFFSKHDR